MTVTEAVRTVASAVGIGGLIIILGSLIKIQPLNINIWGWIARGLGNALNRDVFTKLKEIEDRQSQIEIKLDNHIKENETYMALQTRKSILIFAQEILQGQCHTKEQFHDVLASIDDYETYSEGHPDFPNNRCLLAIDLIKSNYKERLEKSDFLAEEYRTRIYTQFEEKKKSKQ